jgi:hypothetical protein
MERKKPIISPVLAQPIPPSQIHQSDPVDKFRSLTAKQGRAGSYDGDELGADFTKYSNGYRLPARRK